MATDDRRCSLGRLMSDAEMSYPTPGPRNNRQMKKTPLTRRDYVTLAVVAAVFIGVIAGFALLLMDGVPPWMYHCGPDGCLRPRGGP